MNKIVKENLFSLEEYAERRPYYRAEVMEHKKHRQLALGQNIRLLFEDQKTIQYQIQEMLRIERIFEREAIEEELDAYNPLIPDGHNLKATMMIEYDDPQERKIRLAELIGIEKTVFLQLEGFEKVYPIANEDMSRETPDKTSSVHFLRFEFSLPMINAWLSGGKVLAGVSHPNYELPAQIIEGAVSHTLQQDFDHRLVSH